MLQIEKLTHRLKCGNNQNHLWLVSEAVRICCVGRSVCMCVCGWCGWWCSIKRMLQIEMDWEYSISGCSWLYQLFWCWCCSNYYISKECHVHALKWMEMSDGCLLHRYSVVYFAWESPIRISLLTVYRWCVRKLWSPQTIRCAYTNTYIHITHTHIPIYSKKSAWRCSSLFGASLLAILRTSLKLPFMM